MDCCFIGTIRKVSDNTKRRRVLPAVRSGENQTNVNASQRAMQKDSFHPKHFSEIALQTEHLGQAALSFVFGVITQKVNCAASSIH
ncbi:hypothetical protein HY495_01600 [Candidatus Woesearchaeota archaeon]|nr:hypothetical protein [Candidatus Woesearchaeota archaeon]